MKNIFNKNRGITLVALIITIIILLILAGITISSTSNILYLFPDVSNAHHTGITASENQLIISTNDNWNVYPTFIITVQYTKEPKGN